MPSRYNKSKRAPPKANRKLRKSGYVRKLKAGPQAISPNIVNYIKSMIARNVETKQARPVEGTDIDILPYSHATTHSFTTLNLNQIFQGLTQGLGNGQRVGDEIKVKKLNFKGFINWDSSKIDNTQYRHIPLYVKMFVFKRKDSNDNPATYTGTSGTGENDILTDGFNATSPQNELTDLIRPFNTNVYKIFKTRTFKLGPAAVGNTPDISGQWNNDFAFSQRFSIDLSKHVNIVKYDEGTPYQQNCAFYVGFMVAFANNSSITATTLPPVEIHYTVNMTYEDA